MPKLQWRFTKVDPDREFKASQVENLFSEGLAKESLAATVLREFDQNAGDAMTGDTRILKITFRNVDIADLERYVSVEEGHGEYKEHVRSAIETWGKIEDTKKEENLEFLTSMDESGRSSAWNRVKTLVIEDFGTTGLTGEPRREHDTNSYNFLFSQGEGHKGADKDATGGRFGLGKTTFNYASSANTFWGMTCRHDEEGDSRQFVFGKMSFPAPYKVDLGDGQATEYEGFGFWGEKPTWPGFGDSSAQEFIDVFGLQRQVGDPGLSIVIPWVKHDIGWKDMYRAVIENLSYQILEKKLEVYLEDPDMGTVQEHFHSENLLRKYRSKERDLWEDGWEERWAKLTMYRDAVNLMGSEPAITINIGKIPEDTVDSETLRDNFSEEIQYCKELLSTPGNTVRIRVKLAFLHRDKGKQLSTSDEFDVFYHSCVGTPDKKQRNLIRSFQRKHVSIHRVSGPGTALKSSENLITLVHLDGLNEAGEFSHLHHLMEMSEDPSHTEWKYKTSVRSLYPNGGRIFLVVANQFITSMFAAMYADEEDETDRKSLSFLFPIIDPAMPDDKHIIEEDNLDDDEPVDPVVNEEEDVVIGPEDPEEGPPGPGNPRDSYNIEVYDSQDPEPHYDIVISPGIGNVSKRSEYDVLVRFAYKGDSRHFPSEGNPMDFDFTDNQDDWMGGNGLQFVDSQALMSVVDMRTIRLKFSGEACTIRAKKVKPYFDNVRVLMVETDTRPVKEK